MLPPALEAKQIGAGWSSPVARQAHNLKVVGSNPTPATNKKPALVAGFFVYAYGGAAAFRPGCGGGPLL